MTEPLDNQSLPRIQVEEGAGIHRVTFPRRAADGICIRELYEFAAALSDQAKPKLLVDFSALAMVTSAMMGILVQIQKVFRHHNGQLHIAVADELMFMQFQTMHMHHLLKLFYTADDAIASFQK